MVSKWGSLAERGLRMNDSCLLTGIPLFVILDLSLKNSMTIHFAFGEIIGIVYIKFKAPLG